MAEREMLKDDVVELGDAVSETRGTSAFGMKDTDRPLNYVIGLSDED